MGDDLEEGGSFACAQMHREALLLEETTHANVGMPEHAACVQKQSWMGDDISQIHWIRPKRPHALSPVVARALQSLCRLLSWGGAQWVWF